MRKSIDDHKKLLIDDLKTARESILAEVREIPAPFLEACCVGHWSIKDLVAHLTGWDVTNLQAVQEIMSGNRPTFFQHYDPDWQRYNASLVSAYKIEPFEALIAQVVESHRKLITYLQSLPAEDILQRKSPKEQGRSISIRNLLRSEAQDEWQHYEQVKALRLKALA